MKAEEIRKDRIIAKLDTVHRQIAMEPVIKKMTKLQEYVDKDGWDAFVASLYVHGGGFFYLGKYFIGVVAFLGGYAVTLYGCWLVISSVLSYIWQFERCTGLLPADCMTWFLAWWLGL